MDEPHSNIFVAGNYIASQTIGTQIIGGSHSHHYSSPDTRDTPYATRMAEDVEFEDVTVVSDETEKTPDGKRQPYPFVVAEKLAELNLYTMSEFEQKSEQAKYLAEQYYNMMSERGLLDDDVDAAFRETEDR